MKISTFSPTESFGSGFGGGGAAGSSSANGSSQENGGGAATGEQDGKQGKKAQGRRILKVTKMFKLIDF